MTVTATGLDPRETRVDPPHVDSKSPAPTDFDAGIAFRHAGWQRDRVRVHRAMAAAGFPKTRLERFAVCGHNAWVVQHPDDPNVYRIHANTCRDRYCLPCGHARARTFAANLAAIVGRSTFRFITLTLKHNCAPLRTQIDRLFASFRRLRQTAIWKASQTGGVTFLEVKRSSGATGWHPHLHILARGRYLKKRFLSAAWHTVTGDSFIVDITLVKHADEVTRYVTKYASKPMDASIFRDADVLPEALQALKGRRLVSSFGDLRGEQLVLPTDSVDWIPVDTLARICVAARNGDSNAIVIMEKLSCQEHPNRYHTVKQRGPPETTRGALTSTLTDTPCAPAVPDPYSRVARLF